MVTVVLSLHPDALVQTNIYVPAAVNPVMVVVGEVGLVIAAVPGLPLGAADQVPVPVAAIVTEPPGSVTHVAV